MGCKMAATAKKVKVKNSNPDEDRSTIYLPDRNAKITQLACYQTENSGFAPSSEELEDWFEAEINLPYCYNKIAELAFYKAESRGFEPGHELGDWVEAEREFLL